jgi:hypothetical protein
MKAVHEGFSPQPQVYMKPWEDQIRNIKFKNALAHGFPEGTPMVQPWVK